jgi:hypothetical protein
MPKIEIDYSNTIIYKITCIDTNITDVYVGHTTNFVQRKHAHKASCVNEKSGNYKCKLYETIRCNGGWSNWKMEIINFFNCSDHYEARKKEQEYFTLLNANLNSIEPLPKPKLKILEKKEKLPIYCQSCNVYLQNTQLLEIHNNTKKHIKMCNTTNLIEDLTQNSFNCEICNYKCSKKQHIIQHNKTQKHILNHGKQVSKSGNFSETGYTHICNCGKSYTNKSGLWKHKKKCNYNKNITNNELSNNEIIKPQLGDIQEVIKLLIEQQKQLVDIIHKYSTEKNNNVI